MAAREKLASRLCPDCSCALTASPADGCRISGCAVSPFTSAADVNVDLKETMRNNAASLSPQGGVQADTQELADRGDADTIASMARALAGVHSGTSAMPAA